MSADTQHPRWCAAEYCTAARNRLHHSTTTKVGGYDESGQWAVALIGETGGPTLVELVKLSDAYEEPAIYLMSAGVARGLGRVLASHGIVAAGEES